MQYIDMFPTPVYASVELDLRNEILPVAEDYINRHGKPYRDQSSYISTYNDDGARIEQVSDKRLEPLNTYIKSAAKKYFEDISIEPVQFSLYYLFNKITLGGEHANHAHPQSILSGVFYLKIPEDAPPIIFNDPRDHYKYIQYPVKFGNPREMYKLLPEYVINPTEGMILMWPSWLEHQVPASKCSEARIAVAFNVNRE
jgi:uncharacterized protein (TIGR02466 family)